MDTRVCSVCKQEKPVTEFYKQVGCRDGLRPDCKGCKKDSSKVRRAALIKKFGRSDFRQYSDRYHDLEKISRKKIERTSILRQWVDAIKEDTPCTDCNQKFPAVCMDFDHLPEFEKKYGVAQMLGMCYSREAILKEIAKCDLVCSNCHRIRTWRSGREMPWYDKQRVHIHEDT